LSELEAFNRLQAFLSGTVVLPAGATWWASQWGAVSVTNGLKTVVGSGTTFTKSFAVGQQVSFANQPGTVYTVATITNDTHLTLTANFTGATNAATAIGFPSNPAFPCSGQKRLKGYFYSSVPPGAVQIWLSQDGVNFDINVNGGITADTNNPDTYQFDIDLLGSPYFHVVLTDAGAGSTIRMLLYLFEQGSGPSNISGSSMIVVTTTVTPLTIQPEKDNQGADFQFMPATANLRLGLITVEEAGSPSGPASIVVRAGANDAAPPIAYINLNPGEDRTISLFPDVSCAAGVWVNVVSGVVNFGGGTRTSS
jgi:hypothetical protein